MSIREGKKKIKANKLKIIQVKKELKELCDKQDKLKTVHKKQVRNNNAIYAGMDRQYNYELKRNKEDARKEINDKEDYIKRLEKSVECEAKEIPKTVRLLEKTDVVKRVLDFSEINDLCDVYSECKDLPEC